MIFKRSIFKIFLVLDVTRVDFILKHVRYNNAN